MAKVEIFKLQLEASQYLDVAKKIQDEITKLQEKQAILNATNKKNSKEWIANATAIKANRSELLRTQKTIISLESPYAKLSNQLIRTKREAKDLAAKFGLNSVQATKARDSVKKLDSQLKKIDSSLGDNQRSVGGYSQAIKGLASQMLGWTAVIFGAIRALKDIAKRVIQFDKSMVGLAAILGVSRMSLKGLEEEIINVAGASIKTSNEVADLATTLATLGKSKAEIIKLLKPVNDLSIGLQATSEEAGQLLVKTLNAFGESGKEAERYADIIAKMRTSTALDFEQIKDSLGFLAPVAKTAGISFEETGAILGVLVDNGIKAARAGRLTSTAFLKLAADGKTLNDALDEINKAQAEGKKETELLTIASKLFGKQSAALGIILANNRDRTAELTTEFEGAGGALKKLTDAQLESLDAKLKILDSTWEKFILSLDDGTSLIGRQVIRIIERFTGAIETLTIFFDSSIGMWDKSKIAINAWSSQLSILIPGVKTGTGFFEEQVQALIRHESALSDSTKEIESMNEAFIELNGSLSPLEEQQERIIKNWGLFSDATKTISKTDEQIAAEKKRLEDEAKRIEDEAKKIEDEKVKKAREEENELKRIQSFEDKKRILKNEIDLENTENEQEREALKIEQEFENNALELERIDLTETEKTELLLLLQENRDNELLALKDKYLSESGEKQHEANKRELTAEKAQGKAKVQAAKQLTSILEGLLGDSLAAKLAGILLQAAVEAGTVSISTASAQAQNIAQAVATAPPPANAPFIAAALAQNSVLAGNSAAAITKILSSAAVSGVGAAFESGGMLNGNSHSDGGININAEGGEAIINKKSMANPFLRSLASDINVAGGGVAFADGGIVGGSINNTLNSFNSTSLEQINALIDGKIANIVVQNVATETVDIAQDVINVENIANL